MLMSRPSISDTKYDNMSYSEAKLNYDRDLLLYEQTLALNQMAEEQHQAKIREYASMGDFSHLEDLDGVSTYYPFNKFNGKTDVEKYNKYERLHTNYNKLEGNIYYLSTNVIGFLFAILSVLIIAEFICLVGGLQMTKTFGYAILFQLGLIFLLEIKKHRMSKQSENILEELKEMDKEAEKIAKSKNFSRKVIRKKTYPTENISIQNTPVKNIQTKKKEVLNLEH